MDVNKIIQTNQAISLLKKQRQMVLKEIAKRRAILVGVSLFGKNEKLQTLTAEIQGYESELSKVQGQLDDRTEDLKKAMVAN